jgi:hypothetical protein
MEIGAVVAKVECREKTETQYSPTFTQHKVKFAAVYSSTGENATFSKATPQGECWLVIDPSMPALSFFKPGKKYYMTFTEAPD